MVSKAAAGRGVIVIVGGGYGVYRNMNQPWTLEYFLNNTDERIK